MMRFITDFFNSYAGMFIAQSFCHSVVAAFITGRAMKSWKIYDPAMRQRFQLAVIVLPIVSFPLYQAINTARSSPQFRLEALFDVNRWLMLEVGGLFPIGLIFILLVSATSLVFLFQEMIPVLKHTFLSKPGGQEGTSCEPDPFVKNAAAQLGIEVPGVSILDDEDMVLFSTTGKHPVIFLSKGLAASIDRDQMKAALAHELAHIARNKRPLLVIVFVLRVVLFFNPVVLLKFRRAVRDEEKICDDMAVALTGSRTALATALGIFYRKAGDSSGQESAPAPDAATLEEQSHHFHIESRIKRLQQETAEPANRSIFPLATAVAVTIVVNYFIV